MNFRQAQGQLHLIIRCLAVTFCVATAMSRASDGPALAIAGDGAGSRKHTPRIRLRRPSRSRATADNEEMILRWSGQTGRSQELLPSASLDGGATWTTLGHVRASRRSFSWTPDVPATAVTLALRDVAGRLRSNEVLIDIPPHVVDVAFTASFAFAVHSDGSVRTWGRYPDADGYIKSTVARPTPVPELGTIRGVAGGGNRVIVIREDGHVLVWPGLSTAIDGTTAVGTPVEVDGVDDAAFARVNFDTCFVAERDGRVLAWGSNAHGSLGVGDSAPRTEPFEVPELRGALDIALGRYAGVALMPDGSVLSWGANGAGQGGDGTFVGSQHPRPVLGVAAATAIAMRGEFAMALLVDGTVMAWGSNQLGQLGSPPFQPWADPNPTRVGGLPPIERIECGYEVAYALAKDGALLAWGANGRGQMGNGTTNGSFRPRKAKSRDVSKLFVGDAVVHMLDGRGRRYAWGSNVSALVGDGSLQDRVCPTRLYVR